MADENKKFKQRLEERLWSEFEDIRNANMKDIWDIKVDDTNIWKWKVLIVPHCVPYNKGAFRIEITFLDGYPFRPPKILFNTKIYHPNVDEEGFIHLEILSKYWRPAMQMEQVFRGLIAVVNDPNPYNSLNPEISKLSKKEFIKTAIEMTENFSEERPDDTDRAMPKEVGKIASRLRDELKELQEANMKCFKNIRVFDIWTWTGLLVPDCAPYNKGAFRFEINIPLEYPQEPPKIYFRTKIYHPNIRFGRVDMRETCVKWISTRRMIEVFKALQKLLSTPDVDHFPPHEVSEVYMKSREKFLRTAEEFAKQFAEKVPSEDTCEPEGKCLAFVDTTEEMIVAVDSITLKEGKCLEIKSPSEEKKLINNTENATQELSDKLSSDDCNEPTGKC